MTLSTDLQMKEGIQFSMAIMDMSTYLIEIEHAAAPLFPLIWDEANDVARLEREVKQLSETAQREYQEIERFATMFEDDEDGIATMRRWENYFGPDKESYDKAKDVEAAAAVLATHRFSVSAISGILLQFAKQGLSVVYGAPGGWPMWTAIGTQGFGTVIRQARNQALHWEERSLNQPTVDCFNKMAAEADAVFGDYDKRSLAFEVVSRLNWRTLDSFKVDMQRAS